MTLLETRHTELLWRLLWTTPILKLKLEIDFYPACFDVICSKRWIGLFEEQVSYEDRTKKKKDYNFDFRFDHIKQFSGVYLLQFINP